MEGVEKYRQNQGQTKKVIFLNWPTFARSMESAWKDVM